MSAQGILEASGNTNIDRTYIYTQHRDTHLCLLDYVTASGGKQHWTEKSQWKTADFHIQAKLWISEILN